MTYDDCPTDLDILFVPGGLKGSVDLMKDETTLAFLRDRGQRAKYVTSVCTGSLVLGAAGLLKGFQATSHWYVGRLLPLLGATEAEGRVVIDRNRVTGGGATAGVDFCLTILALMKGEELARRVQLILEYDPKPPFDSGNPASAGKVLTDDALARRAPVISAAEKAAREARI